MYSLCPKLPPYYKNKELIGTFQCPPTQDGQTLRWILFLFKGKVNIHSKHFHVYFVYSYRGLEGGHGWPHKSSILLLFDSVIIETLQSDNETENNIWFSPTAKLFFLNFVCGMYF